MKKLAVAVLGSGNIGTDLMYKIMKNPALELRMVAGIDPSSQGLALAKKMGIQTSANGIEAVMEDHQIELVFDATSAKAHLAHAPLLLEAGKIAIDLTPAAVGPYVIPAVNMKESLQQKNINLVSCAAQATIPIVAAINRVAPVSYAEIASTVSSRSVGPGTRKNIDEFTHTTMTALKEIGGAEDAKAIVAINPADPPIIMRNTIYTELKEETNFSAIKDSILDMVQTIQSYVPGYKIKVEPFWDEDHITTLVEVAGAGDYLPAYAGNLDIITAAAVRVAEQFAASY